KLPAIYPFPNMVAEGGLMCHAPNVIDQCRPAAEYVDRILKGEKPGDLPVQAPTKYQVVINLKDRQSPRPHRSTRAACSSRRADRIVVFLLRRVMSAFGTKRDVRSLSAFGG